MVVNKNRRTSDLVEVKKASKRRKRKPFLARKWLFYLDETLKKIPRNSEREKVDVDHLDAHFTDFKDLPLQVVFSAWGYHSTFKGFSFSPEAEVPLLCTESPFYLKIRTFIDCFEFEDDKLAELWLLRRAETAHKLKALEVENFCLSLVIMIRTTRFRKERLS